LTRARTLVSRRWFSGDSSNRSGHGLSHVDPSGALPRMVDVGNKAVTRRSASAQAIVLLPTPTEHVFDSSRGDFVAPKGPVFVTAVIAATSAVKMTSTLLPFCHPLPLSGVSVHLERVERAHPLGRYAIAIRVDAHCEARTGVEMEALTGASVAALTVYDMLKALSHDIQITDVKLVRKTGGKSDYNAPAGQQQQATPNNANEGAPHATAS
jgi:cyclic pyranopterin phosphate synthase